MKRHFILIVILFALIFAGCSQSLYLVDEPFVMYPYAILENKNIQERSMESLLRSFAERGWTILKIDKENNTVLAEVSRHGQYRMELLATVKSDGSVEIIRTPGQKIKKRIGRLLQRYITLLNRSFVKNYK